MQRLTEKQWAVLKPLLPKQTFKKGRRPRAKDRKTLNGILWVLRTGAQWSEMPRRFGSYTTAWRRLKAWEEDGTWERIWRKLLQVLSHDDKLKLSIGMVDGTFA
ncbi:MAG: transposase, partial [Candidatus Levyibacteriota bacterium]